MHYIHNHKCSLHMISMHIHINIYYRFDRMGALVQTMAKLNRFYLNSEILMFRTRGQTQTCKYT